MLKADGYSNFQKQISRPFATALLLLADVGQVEVRVQQSFFLAIDEIMALEESRPLPYVCCKMFGWRPLAQPNYVSDALLKKPHSSSVFKLFVIAIGRY